MIRKNQRLLNGLNMLSDWFIIALMMIPAYAMRVYLNDGDALAFDTRLYLVVGLAVATCDVILFRVVGLYRSFRSNGIQRELAKLFQMEILGAGLLMAGLFFFRLEHFSRMLLAIYFASTLLVTSLKRMILRSFLRYWRAKGWNQKHVILIGSGETAKQYLEALKRNPQLGYVARSYVGPRNGSLSMKHWGNYDNLEIVLKKELFDEAVIALEPEEHKRLKKIVAVCENAGMKFAVIPFGYAHLTNSPQIEMLDGVPMITIRKIPLEYWGNAVVKRSFDILVAGLMLVFLSPVMLVAAIGVKCSSEGPILFHQERVGFNRKPFYMLKFRSMKVNSTQQTGWSTQTDDRRTWFGSFIRKCSIDELPQLWNVLCGDMSLIGPRPELPHFVEQFREDIPLYMVKHQIRPGITGWAQVHGLRGDSSIEERIRYDLYYLENWTFGLDLRILIKTACLGFLNNETLEKPASKEEKEKVGANK